MSYKPGQATPSDLPNLVRYLFRELQRVGQALDVLNSPIPTLNSAPERPEEGLMVIADGVGWNPGSGNGLYIYLNSAWTFIV
tara:strand:- start:59 stop:304 length:246 start_codon:yes stop_codon:yes gene_type:complete